MLTEQLEDIGVEQFWQVVTLPLREPTVTDSKSLWRPKPPLLKWPSFPPLNISAASRKGQSWYVTSISAKPHSVHSLGPYNVYTAFKYHGIYSTVQSSYYTFVTKSAFVYCWQCFAICFEYVFTLSPSQANVYVLGIIKLTGEGCISRLVLIDFCP